jgi:hypothetical protein
VPIQNHYRFWCDGRIVVNVSAESIAEAQARLERVKSFDSIEYIGLNPNLEPYAFERRSRDWLRGVSEPFKRVASVLGRGLGANVSKDAVGTLSAPQRHKTAEDIMRESLAQAMRDQMGV